MAKEPEQAVPASPEPPAEEESAEEEWAVGSSDKPGVVVYSRVPGSGKDDSAPDSKAVRGAKNKALQPGADK